MKKKIKKRSGKKNGSKLSLPIWMWVLIIVVLLAIALFMYVLGNKIPTPPPLP